MFSKLFHAEVFVPKGVYEQVHNLQKNIETVELSKHFQEQHVDTSDYKHCLQKTKIMSAIDSLKKTQVNPFEIELSKDYRQLGPGWHVTKYVVRVSYDNTRDVTFVIALKKDDKTNKLDYKKAFIKTAWLNDKYDVHSTLDKSKYNIEL
jgi:hypothetical protein